MFLRKHFGLWTILGALSLGAVTAHANLLTALPQMGDLMRWGVFALGGDVSIDNVSGSGQAYVKGDVGVAGNGNISLTGKGLIDGDLWYRSNGTLTRSGKGSINGSIFHNTIYDPQLDNGVTEAINTSNAAFAMPATPTYSYVTDITGPETATFYGAPGQTVVLKLQNLTLSSGAVTLVGSPDTNFIINVSKNFSLTNHSSISLSGGLAWDDVLINVTGTGKNISLDGGSTMSGILMANGRTVNNAGSSIVYGEIVANAVSLSGSAQVIHPPVSSP